MKIKNKINTRKLIFIFSILLILIIGIVFIINAASPINEQKLGAGKDCENDNQCMSGKCIFGNRDGGYGVKVNEFTLVSPIDIKVSPTGVRMTGVDIYVTAEGTKEKAKNLEFEFSQDSVNWKSASINVVNPGNGNPIKVFVKIKYIGQDRNQRFDIHFDSHYLNNPTIVRQVKTSQVINRGICEGSIENNVAPPSNMGSVPPQEPSKIIPQEECKQLGNEDDWIELNVLVNGDSRGKGIIKKTQAGPSIAELGIVRVYLAKKGKIGKDGKELYGGYLDLIEETKNNKIIGWENFGKKINEKKIPIRIQTIFLLGTGNTYADGFVQKTGPTSDKLKESFIKNAQKMGMNDITFNRMISDAMDKLPDSYPAGSDINIITGPCDPYLVARKNKGTVFREKRGGILSDVDVEKSRQFTIKGIVYSEGPKSAVITDEEQKKAFRNFFFKSLSTTDELNGDNVPLRNMYLADYSRRLSGSIK